MRREIFPYTYKEIRQIPAPPSEPTVSEGPDTVYCTTRKDTGRGPAPHVPSGRGGSHTSHTLPTTHTQHPTLTRDEPCSTPCPFNLQHAHLHCSTAPALRLHLKGSRGSTPIRFSLVRPSDLCAYYLPHISGRTRVRHSGQVSWRGRQSRTRAEGRSQYSTSHMCSC